MQERISDLVKPIEVIQHIIERGRESGEFRADLDPALAAVVFYGGIDEVLTGWVLGQLPSGMADVEAAERTVVEVLAAGFSASLAAADELCETLGADVPAGDHDADRRAAQAPVQQRRDSDGAARLDDDLQAVEEERHRLDDLGVVTVTISSIARG
jgi:hypothetical protein